MSMSLQQKEVYSATITKQGYALVNLCVVTITAIYCKIMLLTTVVMIVSQSQSPDTVQWKFNGTRIIHACNMDTEIKDKYDVIKTSKD